MSVLNQGDVLCSREGDPDAVAESLEGEIDDLERAGAVELGGEGLVVDGGLGFWYWFWFEEEDEVENRRLVFDIESAWPFDDDDDKKKNEIVFGSGVLSRTSFTACARKEARRVGDDGASLGRCAGAEAARGAEARGADRTGAENTFAVVVADIVVACF